MREVIFFSTSIFQTLSGCIFLLFCLVGFVVGDSGLVFWFLFGCKAMEIFFYNSGQKVVEAINR